MAESRQRRTALAVVESFNKMDVNGIISHRSPDCMRHFLPPSMGNKPQSNTTYAKNLHQLSAIFHNFSLTVTDMLEDKDAARICLWMNARADTMAGVYNNDYVWLLEFDESGEKIICSKEYSDTLMSKEFYPKLQAAMNAHQARNTA